MIDRILLEIGDDVSELYWNKKEAAFMFHKLKKSQLKYKFRSLNDLNRIERLV